MILRRILSQDLNKLFELRNNYEIYKWCRQCAPLHWESHKKWYEWQAEDKSVSMFTIVDLDETIIGVCGLTSIDFVNRRAEFSIYIDPKKSKSGFGSEALKLLMQHGFFDLGLHTIWGEVFDENPALQLFLKAGMEIEGTRKGFYYRDGKFIDAHLISINVNKFNNMHGDNKII